MRSNVQLILLLFTLLTTSLPSFAQQTPEAKVKIFSEAIEAIGEAGNALVKITDGVKHLVVVTYEGYSFYETKQTQHHLIEMSVQSTSLHMSQSLLAQSIDDYLEKENPTDGDWFSVKINIKKVQSQIQTVLDGFASQKDQFALEKSYGEIILTLGSRGQLLDKITNLSAPKTDTERALLAQLNIKYKELIENFNQALTQMNEYIKQNYNKNGSELSN